ASVAGCLTRDADHPRRRAWACRAAYATRAALGPGALEHRQVASSSPTCRRATQPRAANVSPVASVSVTCVSATGINGKDAIGACAGALPRPRRFTRFRPAAISSGTTPLTGAAAADPGTHLALPRLAHRRDGPLMLGVALGAESGGRYSRASDAGAAGR